MKQKATRYGMKAASRCWFLREARRQILPTGPSNGNLLADTLTFSPVKLILGFFQNCDIRCFNPLGLWYFVITTLGNVYKYPGTNGHYFLVASNLPNFLTHPQTTPQINPFCHLPENLIVPRVHSHPSLPWANTPNLVQSWVFCWVLMVGHGRPS